MVESLQEGVVALDRDGHITAWNRAMEMRYEVSAAEVLGRDFFEVFPAVRREPWADSLRKLLDGEIEEFVLEAVEHQTLRMGRVVLNLKGNRLRRNVAPGGTVLLVEDITERVGLERSARQAEKMAAVGTLAAGVAHELNNPIGIISSRIELMLLDAESQPLPDEFRKDLVVLHRHAQRVARIVQGLLSFARPAPAEQGAVDLNRVVEETLLLIERQIAKDGITVTRRLTPALPAVWGDAHALQQVLMNLVTNARDALGARGEIAIATERVAGPPEGVRLTVRDGGPGIPREILAKIFDPFFTTKPSGTGLGLSISYGIVRDHHGTIEVQSEPARDDLRPQLPRERGASGRGHGVSEAAILIVDDEPDMVENCARILRRAGYRCLTATDSHRALALLESEAPDVLLTDLKMPGMDGMELLRRARDLDPSLPVVMITAFATIESAVAAVKEGAFDYLPKNFSVEQLQVAVERALRQRQLQVENRNLRQQLQATFGLENVIGRSPAMTRVFELVKKAARSRRTSSSSASRAPARS